MNKNLTIDEQRQRENEPDNITKWLVIFIVIGVVALFIKNVIA